MQTKLFLTLLLLVISVSIIAQPSECVKTFKISGPDKNGDNKEVIFTAKKRTNDFTPEQAEAQKKFEKTKYTDFDYVYMGEPSEVVDCAGYVMNKIWNTGIYRVGGPNFSTSVVYNFGKPISGMLGWGSAQKGDIVVWERSGIGNHIAIVREVTTVLSVTTSVIVETKDGSESVYIHTLPDYTFRDSLGLLNDPLIRNWGIPSIYRIDPTIVSISEVNPSECEETVSTGDLSADWAGVWYKPGFSLTLSGSGSNISMIYFQDPNSSGYASTKDPRKFYNVKLVDDKITGRWESDPMYEDNFLNKKAKASGTFEMKLVKLYNSDKYSLEGATLWDSEYCHGCIDTWVWLREKEN